MFNKWINSKVWNTCMTWVISNKSFWAMIALFFFWIELSSYWTNNAIFTVPKWKLWWTVTCWIRSTPYSSISFLIGWTFALSCGWINLSWGWTGNFAIASIWSCIIEVTLWARLTFSAYGIPEERCSTFNTIITNFIISSWAAWLDLEVRPWSIRWWELRCSNGCNAKNNKDFA